VTHTIPQAVQRLCYRYPSLLVDAVEAHTPGKRLVAIKNVSVNEDFFQGHFPGAPLMPGVLMIETLAQAAAILLVEDGGGRTHLRGVDNAKFRRQVIPGDRIRLEVSLLRRRARLARVRGVAWVDDTVVAEADLLLALDAAPAEVHPSASVAPGARIGSGTTIGPNAVIGPNVVIGRNCRIGASAVIEGWTELGDENDVYPFASIGQPPQDLKYRGAPTRLAIGHRNVFREFVTIHRGTEHGGGLTTIGDRNLFMAYSHVAHDCHVGSEVIFGNGATIGGHVTVEDYATVSAFSGVHQFCRVGRHAFVGGYSVLTKDAMPYAKTVGNRAKIYGLNTIGLLRRGFAPETVAKLKKAYRLLLTSKLNATRAIAQIAESEDLACDEVRYLLQFIAQSQRGVTLKHGTKRAEDGGDD
jgi:UDP-N-acetylglucosamine acyltransferase